MLPCGQGGGGRGASLLGTDASPPNPTPHPVHPGPWELTYCGWDQCGPSQTPSTPGPSENPALRPASKRSPRCLRRGSGPGPHSGSASLPPSLGAKTSPSQSSPLLQTALVPASCVAVRARLRTTWGSSFTQRTMWKRQCTRRPRLGGVHVIPPTWDRCGVGTPLGACS